MHDRRPGASFTVLTRKTPKTNCRQMQVTDLVTEVRTRVRSLTDLPPIPAVAQRLLTLLTDENVELDEIARTIEMDPGLSARIIGLAGSAFFGSPLPIYSVREAILRVLGLNMVKSLAISVAISGGFKVDQCKEFDIQRYWGGAMLTADLAQRLAGAVTARADGESDPPDLHIAYLSGLLHNLGLLVLTHLYPAEMAKAFAAAKGGQAGSLLAAERELLGVDHHETGSWLAQRWHLPNEVITVMTHHQEPQYRGDAWPVSLLTGMCARMVQRQQVDGEEMPMEPDSLEALGIPESRVEQAWNASESQRDELQEMAKLFAKAA